VPRSRSSSPRRYTDGKGVVPAAADQNVADLLEQARQDLRRSAELTARVEQKVRALIDSGQLPPDAVARTEELLRELRFYDEAPLLTTFSAEAAAYIGNLQRDYGVDARHIKKLLFPIGSPFAIFSRLLDYQAVCHRLAYYKRALISVETHGDVPDPTLPLFYERQALRTLLVALAKQKEDLSAQLASYALPLEWRASIARSGVHAT
jgi:hypothetical protein